MIKKSFISFLIIIIIFSVAIVFFPTPTSVYQTPYIESQITAQNFIHELPNNSSVIVGSSMACRLRVSNKNDGIYNLSFGGRSILDGLDIIKQSGKTPSVIFIETNMILIEQDSNFTNDLFAPCTYHSKHLFPALRAKNQPLGLAGHVMFKIVSKIEYEFDKHFGKKGENMSSESIIKAKTNDEFFNRLLRIQQDYYNLVPPDSIIEEKVNILKKYIDYFQKQNTTIVFFEMPAHPNICNSEKANKIRTSVLKYFPKGQYKYMKEFSCEDYSTTDGLHLDYHGSLKISPLFINYANEYL